jgi:hypothetical protein
VVPALIKMKKAGEDGSAPACFIGEALTSGY